MKEDMNSFGLSKILSIRMTGDGDLKGNLLT